MHLVSVGQLNSVESASMLCVVHWGDSDDKGEALSGSKEGTQSNGAWQTAK